MALSAVEPLSDSHDLAGFECGKSALDDWLRTFARSNQRQDFMRVMVIHEDTKVVGYYGLAPSAIDPGAAPRRVRTGRPPDPIPCLLIGQLAVDRRHQGRGIGSMLVADAFRRCIAGAEIIGGRAVVVRAIDTEAEVYWQSWGFVAARDNPSILMRSVADTDQNSPFRSSAPYGSSRRKLMGWTPPDGIDVPKWRCRNTT